MKRTVLIVASTLSGLAIIAIVSLFVVVRAARGKWKEPVVVAGPTSAATKSCALPGWEDLALGQKPPDEIMKDCTYPVRTDQDPERNTKQCSACRDSAPCIEALLHAGKLTMYSAVLPMKATAQHEIQSFLIERFGKPTSTDDNPILGGSILQWARADCHVMLVVGGSKPSVSISLPAANSPEQKQTAIADTPSRSNATAPLRTDCGKSNFVTFIFNAKLGRIDEHKSIGCPMDAGFMQVLQTTDDGWLVVSLGTTPPEPVAAIRTDKRYADGAFVTRRRVQYLGLARFDRYDGAPATLPSFRLLDDK